MKQVYCLHVHSHRKWNKAKIKIPASNSHATYRHWEIHLLADYTRQHFSYHLPSTRTIKPHKRFQHVTALWEMRQVAQGVWIAATIRWIHSTRMAWLLGLGIITGILKSRCNNAKQSHGRILRNTATSWISFLHVIVQQQILSSGY